MAWWSVDKCSEPLMYLERPSTSSSQKTAHIIVSCFSDVLSEKLVDSTLAIANIESGSSEFRKYYVEKLKKISDNYDEQLEELSRVEHHLLEAKAKAAKMDKQQTELVTSNYPAHNEVQFPHKKSCITQFLDEQLLDRHHMLSPSKYLIEPLSPQPPPTVEKDAIFPPHLKTTETSRQHAQRISEKCLHLPPITTKKVSLTKKSEVEQWKKYLSVPDRLAEKSALAELAKKTAFPRNPKYSENDINNTASNGAMKTKQRSKEPSEYNSLMIEPSEIVFTDYLTGGTYQESITVTNVSSVSRLLRLTHFDSPYFFISPGDFPCGDNKIAPGMCCTFTVTFKPDSLANFADLVQFVGSNGQYLKVSLKGVRAVPVLSIPSELNCGGCLIGNSKTSTFTCENSGGDGCFNFLFPTNTDLGVKNYEEHESLIIERFEVSPKEFAIKSGDKVDINVVFNPQRIGQHTEEILLTCDNGSSVNYILTGSCEMVNIGCTQVRSSSTTEKLSFSCHLVPGDAVMIQATILPTHEDCENIKIIAKPIVEFPSVCPLDSSYQTIVIHNFSNVSLPFVWQYYRPFTTSSEFELLNAETEKPTHDILEISKQCQFHISPASGMLPPGKATAFVAQFYPKQVGDYVDMGYLTLTGGYKMEALESSLEMIGWRRLSERNVAITCVQLHGIAQPFQLEIFPPAWIIPGKVPYSTEFKRKITVINHSLSEVHSKWEVHLDEVVSINISPNSGVLGIREKMNFEVSAIANGVGNFQVNIWCFVEGSPTGFPFLIQGCIEEPMIEIYPGSIDYGLIQFCHSTAQTIQLTNISKRKVYFLMKQLVQVRNNGFMDYECLAFKPSEGKLLPQKPVSVVVECKGTHPGRLWTTVQLLINHTLHTCMLVEANVQVPSLSLDSCTLHMEEAYVGVMSQHQIILHNNTVISTQYMWKAQVFGADGRYSKVNINEMTGKIAARESINISLEITWTKKGKFQDAVLMCEVVGTNTPVILAISAEVKGLSVEYNLQKHQSDKYSEDLMSVAFPLDPETERPMLDYASDVELRKSVTKIFCVTNKSAIPATLEMFVINFPCANNQTYSVQPSSVTKRTFLLKRTRNGSLSEKSNTELATQFLSEGRGACFLVEPAKTELQAFETVQVAVTAYADMWGHYKDQLYCKVEGLDTHVIEVKMDVAGCPINFQSTGHYGNTTLRFGSHLAESETVKRVMKIKNESPVDLQINWCLFNIILGDNQFIDLTTYYGRSFQSISASSSILTSEDKCETKNSSGKSERSADIHQEIITDTLQEKKVKNDVKYRDELVESLEGFTNQERGTVWQKEKETRISPNLQIYPQKSSGKDDDLECRDSELHGQIVKSSVNSGNDIMELDEERAIRNSDSVELGEPLVRKQAEWSFATHLQEEGVYEETILRNDEENTVHVLLKVHEGVQAKSPFTISPKQLVIPSRGQATVVAMFTPSTNVIDKLGPAPSGYALGYMNIINEEYNGSHLKRAQGYAVAPLRINMMGGIDKSELLLDCQDDNGLHFVVPASLLLNGNLEMENIASEGQHFTLTNSGTSVMKFQLYTSSSHFHVSLAISGTSKNYTSAGSVITIKPQETVQLMMQFSFTLGNIREKQLSTSKGTLDYNEELQIKFSTGQTQKISLSATIHLPVLSLMNEKDCMGTCLLDSSNSTSLVISNSSMSAALWRIYVVDNDETVAVYPQSGILMPYKSVDKLNVQLVQIIFTPRSEDEFNCCLTVKEELTQRTQLFHIKGIGSADEQFTS